MCEVVFKRTVHPRSDGQSTDRVFDEDTDPLDPAMLSPLLARSQRIKHLFAGCGFWSGMCTLVRRWSIGLKVWMAEIHCGFGRCTPIPFGVKFFFNNGPSLTTGRRTPRRRPGHRASRDADRSRRPPCGLTAWRLCHGLFLAGLALGSLHGCLAVASVKTRCTLSVSCRRSRGPSVESVGVETFRILRLLLKWSRDAVPMRTHNPDRGGEREGLQRRPSESCWEGARSKSGSGQPECWLASPPPPMWLWRCFFGRFRRFSSAGFPVDRLYRRKMYTGGRCAQEFFSVIPIETPSGSERVITVSNFGNLYGVESAWSPRPVETTPETQSFSG